MIIQNDGRNLPIYLLLGSENFLTATNNLQLFNQMKFIAGDAGKWYIGSVLTQRELWREITAVNKLRYWTNQLRKKEELELIHLVYVNEETDEIGQFSLMVIQTSTIYTDGHLKIKLTAQKKPAF